MPKRSDLHPYQLRMIEHCKEHKRCALFVDMGMGKTAATLYAIQDLFDEFEVAHVLIIAPLRVARFTWPDEIRDWDGLDLDYAVACGTVKEREAAVRARKKITIVNRENIPWLIEFLLHNRLGWKYDLIVIDELSSFKSTDARRWRALKAVIHRSPRVIGLTGTPAPNGLIDLYAQLYLLDKGERLGRTKGMFEERFFNKVRRGESGYAQYFLKRGAEEKIHAAVADICMSLRSEDYLDLPPLVVNDILVELSPSERERYLELEEDMLLRLEKGSVEACNGAVLTQKLQQFANGAIFDSEDATVWHEVHRRKLEVLDEIVEETGSPILLAYSHTPDRDRILARYPQAKFLDKEPETIAAWNRGEIPLLVTHPASAGHGLNLQKGGCTMVYFGMPWSLEYYQQMSKRLHRQGQERRVVMHRLLTRDTVDTTIAAALESKDITQAALIHALRVDATQRTVHT